MRDVARVSLGDAPKRSLDNWPVYAAFTGAVSHGILDHYMNSRGFRQTYVWAKSGKTQSFVGFQIERVNTVIDWAYQNNGIAIEADDTGIVPEPSTKTLAILSAGARVW